MTLREKMTPHLVKAFSSEMFGQLVEYQGAEIDAIFSPGVNPKFVSGGSAAKGELQVMISDIPDWNYRDKVVIDGLEWTVKGEGEGSNWFKHVLVVECDRRMKV